MSTNSDVSEVVARNFARLNETIYDGVTNAELDRLADAAIDADAHDFDGRVQLAGDTRHPMELLAATVQVRLLAIADVLSGIVAVCRDEGRPNGPSPAFSALVLARGALEAAAYAYWLVEPGVSGQLGSSTERVRRLVLDTLHDLKHRHRVLDLARQDGLDLPLADDVARLVQMCDLYGLDVEIGAPDRTTDIRFPKIAGPCRPSAFSILQNLLPSDQHQNLGAFVYHGVTNAAHASTQGLLGPASVGTGSEGGLELRLRRQDILRQVLPLPWALYEPVDSSFAYLGVNQEGFRDTFAEVAARLEAWVDSHPGTTKGTSGANL